MSVAILILSNLAQRRDWLIHRLRFLEVAGHRGEIKVGVWGGHDQIPFVEQAIHDFSSNVRITIVAQNGDDLASQRITELAHRCESEFVVIQGDDDFLVPDAVMKAAVMLANTPTAICAQGRCIALSLGDTITTNFSCSQFPVWEAMEEDVLERFVNLMKHYSFTWHAVYRKSQFIERLRYMDDVYRNTNEHIFFECMGDLYSVIKGKIIVFDELYLLRGDHIGNAVKTERKSLNMQMPPYLMLSSNFSRAYKYFEERCLEIFRSMGIDTSSEDAMRQILDGMVSCMRRLFFKARDRLDPGEVTFYDAMKRGGHPGVMHVLELIFRSSSVHR
ncbi:MAG: TIGR00180 family glycosyltransferase [Alphaproteobacteria bacterium]|nr:TIGR00180 family glycosyltransferase [Alphaproteobacteria bacterium]